jgi:acyl carrier protein
MSLDTVKLIFVQRYGVSAEELTADTAISEICNDSLEILELLMFIEDEFKIVFPDDVAQELKTLGDIAGYMDKNISEDVISDIAAKLK